MKITKDMLNTWLKTAFYPGIKQGNVFNTVLDADENFFKTCRLLGKYIASRNILIGSSDTLLNTLSKYTYMIDGHKLRLNQQAIAIAIVMHCMKKGSKFDIGSASSQEEVRLFNESTIGQALIKHGCVEGEPTEETPAQVDQNEISQDDVKSKKDKDMAAKDLLADGDDEEDEEETPAEEPTVTQQPSEPEPKEEPKTPEPAPAPTPAPEPEPEPVPQPEAEAPSEPLPTKKRTRKSRKLSAKQADPDWWKKEYGGNISSDTTYDRRYLRDKEGNYVLDAYGRRVPNPNYNPRKTADTSIYPKMSPYIDKKAMIGTPGIPCKMTGEDQMIYIIKGYGNTTSNKCPKAYVMPLTMQLEPKNGTRTGEIEPVKNLASKKRVNTSGSLKVHIAGSSTLQNQTIYFNTRAEAQAVLDAIIAADDADAAAGVPAKELRIAPGVKREDLIVCGIDLYSVSKYWRHNLEYFSRGFYEIKTEFGNAFLCAKTLWEALDSMTGSQLTEEIPPVEPEQEVDEAYKKAYVDAFNSTFN